MGLDRPTPAGGTIPATRVRTPETANALAGLQPLASARAPSLPRRNFPGALPTRCPRTATPLAARLTSPPRPARATPPRRLPAKDGDANPRPTSLPPGGKTRRGWRRGLIFQGRARGSREGGRLEVPGRAVGVVVGAPPHARVAWIASPGEDGGANACTATGCGVPHCGMRPGRCIMLTRRRERRFPGGAPFQAGAATVASPAP
jgi:hypothetical protein